VGKPEITIRLDIEDVNVFKVEVSQNGDIHIQLESSLDYGYCRKCGRKITKPPSYDDWVSVRHLPIFGQAVYIQYQPKRYECEGCDGGPTTTQQLKWHTEHSPNTVAFERWLLRSLVNSTVQDVALKAAVSDDTVLGVIERQIDTRVDWSAYSRLEVLGIDEIARLKGHGDFVAVVSARLADGRAVVLAVLPDRTKETVKAFLESIPARLKATIRSVCTDLYEGYFQAVEAVLPHVRRVADRFHIAQLYRAAVDELRTAELKRLKATLSKEHYQTLKGSLWAFRLAPQQLEPDQQLCLNRLFEYSPCLKQAYDLRQALTAIFDHAPSPRAADAQLGQWKLQLWCTQIHCFDGFLNTLNRFHQEILNYFIARESSGFVEGLNNKLKVLTRRSYGLFNIAHLFQRLFLDLEGYQRFS
jgi:transposase